MAGTVATVSVSVGAMNSLLAKLTSLLGDEYKLHKATRRDLQFLRDELTLIKDLMHKLAETEELDPLIKGWMKQVREMTYDMEDSLDDVMHRVPRDQAEKPSNWKQRLITKMSSSKTQHAIAKTIRDLTVIIHEVSARRLRYKMDDAVAWGSHVNSMSGGEPRLLPVPVPVPEHRTEAEAGLVGMDAPREKLIQHLADGKMQLQVVGVVGMGGVGKTTLAREVYHSLQERFDCQAFVSLSQNPDVRKTLMSILSLISANDDASIRNSDVEKLISTIREFLRDRRYFIVIDDVWEATAFRMIKCALVDNTCGSRVLVTTRISSIASLCNFIFEIGPLSEDEARKLFFSRIHHSEDKCPPELVKVSNKIIRASGGLPLAITTIASLLSTKSVTVREWERVLHSITSSHEESTGVEALRRATSLSYSDLPFHLRTCLLYLSMFPQDYIIERKRVVRIWMAEGFINEAHGRSLEEVGEFYFNELINRNLLQPVVTQYDGRVHACKVHDLMLDFITSKSVEENFVTRYDDNLISRIQDRVRRLALTMDDHEGTFTAPAITAHVRSLALFGSKHMPDLANFGALRMLDLENFEVSASHYLQNIGKLFLLKYLRLKTTSAIELSDEIGELSYLQTLDLAEANLSKLPKSVVQLNLLCYLLVNNVVLPGGIGKLQALQELSLVKIDGSNSPSLFRELGSLTALRILGINWCISDEDTQKESYADNLVYSLNKVSSSNLQSLYIETADGCSLDFLLDSSSISSYYLQEFRMESEYHFNEIPKWISSLINLTILEINIDPVEDDVFQILGVLPALLVVLLSSKSSPPEQRLLIGNEGFLLLREFGFACKHTWPMIMFEPGAMPKMEKLQLTFSAQGECVPSCLDFGIQHLISLKHIAVDINCRGAKSSEVEAAEDAIKCAASVLPNRPKPELQRYGEEHMVKHEREITAHGDGGEVGHSEVEAAENAIKNAASANPNRPKHELERKDEEHMVNDERDISIHSEGEGGQDELVVGSYLPYVLQEGRAITVRNRQRRLFTNNPSGSWNSYSGKSVWSHVPFEHPATFATLAMDPDEKEAIVDDLVAFREAKEYYNQVGKAWKRGYLLYGPPGTGKSTMIAAVANFLDYDVYDLELKAVKNNTELRKLFIETKGKSIIVIEDIDCSVDLTGKRQDKKGHKDSNDEGDDKPRLAIDPEKDDGIRMTLSGVLNFTDELWSACGGERIIIFTANHKDNLDPALIRRGRMDKHIEMSYCRFKAFKVLAKNYLGVEEHELFGEIGQLLEETDVTPADVAENLMPMSKRKKRDANACLEGLVQALKKAKEEAAAKALADVKEHEKEAAENADAAKPKEGREEEEGKDSEGAKIDRAWTEDDMTTMGSPSLVQAGSNEWVMDASSLSHHTFDLRLLHDLQDVVHTLPARRRGSVQIERFKVPDVHYIQGGTRNVISVAQLALRHDLVTIFGRSLAEPT